MAKTISELRNQSIQVRDASAAGENTATRVGTVLNDIVGHIEDYENTQSSNNSSQDVKIDSVKTSLNAEIARAKTEESNLSTLIGTERTERQAAVSSEETVRIQADNAEKTARMAADNAEQDARIKADNAEKTARENADITLRTMIQAEVSDRESAVKQEETRAIAAENANTQAIADEIARAKAAEKLNADAIASETTRATTEEKRLQGEIDNTNTNVETLDDKVNSNKDHFSDEVARLDLTDNEIKADIAAETARATAAEEDVSTKLSDLGVKFLTLDIFAQSENVVPEIAIENKYIDKQGDFQDYNGYHISAPIKLEAGKMIYVNIIANDVTPLALSDSTINNDSKVTPLFFGKNLNTHQKFVYTAKEDCYVVVCGRSSASIKVKIITNSDTDNILSINDELAKKFDSANITQELGNDKNKVMSQKAVSDKLSDLSFNTKNVDTYSSAKTITLSTGLSNKAIGTNGGIVDSYVYNISTPIKLEAKQMIVVEAIANYSSIICKIDSDTISENSKLTPLVVFYNNPKGDIAVYKYIAEEPCYVVVSDRRNLSETNVRVIDYPYIQKSISTALKEINTKILLSKDIAIMISYGNKIDITINKKETLKDVTINIPKDVVVACKHKVGYFKETVSVTRTNVTQGILWAIINMDSFDVSLQTYSYVPNEKEAYLFGIDLLQYTVTSYNPAIFTFNGKPSLRTNDILQGQDILSNYLNEFHNKYVYTDSLIDVYSNMQEIELSIKLKGYYIDHEGNLISYELYDVSSPIQLKKGETIFTFVTANDSTAIALCDTDDVSLDSKLTSVVYGDNNPAIRKFSYSATDDCYVVISGRSSTLTKAYKTTTNSSRTSLFNIKTSLEQKIDELEQKIDERTQSNDSILYLNDKTIVGNNIVQATRPYSKDMVLSHALCTLSIMTDIHGYQNNLQRYMDFTNEYVSYIDDMLCLGDFITDSWVNTMDFFNNVEGSEKILLTIGNHDTCDRTQNPVVWYQYAGKQAYDRYFAPYIANWEVVQPENAAINGYCWYYKDYNTAKVRLIVLDCMYMFKDTEQAQLQWFTGVLTDAKEKGLSVVAAKHYPFNVVQDKDKNTFNSLDYSSYDGNSKSSMKGFLDAIETFISSGGEFICWLNGDSHYDFQGLITGYPNQYAIAFENAGCNSQWNDSVRIKGTKSQDSFNFVTFDTNTKLIKVVRVGNNSDRYLRHKNYICYDYKNKKIITCE